MENFFVDKETNNSVGDSMATISSELHDLNRNIKKIYNLYKQSLKSN